MPSEQKNPQLGIDIRLIVEPHTHSDPELKTSRQYTNLSAAEVREALVKKGYDKTKLPSERTIRDILNRMNYRLKRIQKGKPLKKTEDTDAIFANVHAAREKYRNDPQTLQISVDTKAKVSLGEYALGGKTRTDSEGNVTKGWDHDPPAKEKLVPFGILILATGALTLLFGNHETSDFWGDCLHAWWLSVRSKSRKVRRLAIYLGDLGAMYLPLGSHQHCDRRDHLWEHGILWRSSLGIPMRQFGSVKQKHPVLRRLRR